MSDPFLLAAREILDLAIEDFRSAIEGASSEALNTRPGAESTNSIAVLAVHSMHSTRSWLSAAVGASRPARNRADEFVATAPDAASLVALMDGMHADCQRLLSDAADVDWTAMRETHARPGGDMPSQVTAAWALMHALEHLREHAGHVQLTRQLVDAA